MNEGGLGAPFRHAINWNDDNFYDEASLDAELRRVFDICHGCRRCFNLCDSFPKLFDLIDDSDTGELDSVSSDNFKPVVDACTLCDMCFMTKCPYVPPHEFDLDFPHLMLRARAIEAKKEGMPFAIKELTKTDRNGEIGQYIAPLANWASKCGNFATRPFLEKTVGIHRDAVLPRFHSKTLLDEVNSLEDLNTSAPSYGRKVVIYATCFVNYNNPKIGIAARNVLAKNGVQTEIVYPNCCGMPQLEQGDLEAVSNSALKVSSELQPWIEKGYDIIALVPSCALMMKFEWPLLIPNNKNITLLSSATRDLTEYIIEISKKDGLADGLKPIPGGISFHVACHARAQNMGQKGAEMLRLIPETKIDIIERCSGHGGSWGFMKSNFETAMKIGKPSARKVSESHNNHIVSECPLARDHLVQGAKVLSKEENEFSTFQHPIELLAVAYGY